MESGDRKGMKMENQSTKRLAGITLLGWISVIGFDFFLHAGILAPLYENPQPFLLSPEKAFALIPLGYFAFLLLVILVIWLMIRLGIKGWRPGLIFGLQLGALIWAAVTISLISISTASLILMLGWFVGQTIETGLAGLIVGAGLEAERMRKILVWVVLSFVGFFVVGIILQNI
jgi:hypothetical protein